MAKMSEKTRRKVKAMDAERRRRLAEMEKRSKPAKMVDSGHGALLVIPYDPHADDDFLGK